MLPPGEIEMKSDWFFGIDDDYFMDSDFAIDETEMQEIDFMDYCDEDINLYGNDLELADVCLECGIVPHGCVCSR